MKEALVSRAVYAFSAIREGIRPLWSAIQVVGAVVGGSLIAYLAVGRKEPLLAVAVFLICALVAGGEGAFRLTRASDECRIEAENARRLFDESAPRFPLGRAVIPKRSQPYELRWGDGKSFVEFGRVIRVPVENCAGAETAKAVQARMVFQPKDIHSSYSPKHPVTAEWDQPGGPVAEVELPGNGAPRLIDVLFIRDRPYPYAFVWTGASRSAALSGFEIASTRIEIEIEISAAGPSRPTLTDTLIVECRAGQMIVADWLSRNPNEEGNNVEWWDGQAL